MYSGKNRPNRWIKSVKEKEEAIEYIKEILIYFLVFSILFLIMSFSSIIYYLLI